MEGSKIQQGTESSNQTGNFNLQKTDNLNEFIKLLKEKRSELELSKDDE
jgi:hypothetical protein